MKIFIFDEQNSLTIDRENVEAIARAVVGFEGQKADEVSIHFVDVPTISELHGLYFDDPSPTDCISFPIDSPEEEDYRILGEVFVCPEIAKEYARKEDGDPYYETTLYIVHGLLHLMGYDDTDELVLQMRTAEERHMDHLQKMDLWLKSPL